MRYMSNTPCPACSALARESNGDGVRCDECHLRITEALSTFTHQDDTFMSAVALGCTPIWVGLRWECRCPESVHGVSTHYPSITLQSLERCRTI